MISHAKSNAEWCLQITFFLCFKHCEIKTCHVIYEKGINQYLIVRLNFECFLPLKYIWEIHRADKGIFRDYGWMQKTEELADIIIRLVATLVKDRTFISVWGFQRHWDNGIFYTTGGNKTTSKQTSLLNLCSWFFTYGFFFYSILWKEMEGRFGLDYENMLMYEKILKSSLLVVECRKEWPSAL